MAGTKSHDITEQPPTQLTKSWAPVGEGTDPENDLTLRYYGLKALDWLQKQRLTAEMRALLENRTREWQICFKF